MTTSLTAVSGFWLPAVEQTEAVVSELLTESGAHRDHSAFRYALRFHDVGGEVSAIVGTRWRPHSLPTTREERRMRRPWTVFAIVAAPTDYVIWKLDIGTQRRLGVGWRIAARVPSEDVVEVREFPSPQGGPRWFVRRRDSSG